MIYIDWFSKVKPSFVPGVNPTQSWYIILLRCCWISLAKILLRIFLCVFMRNNFSVIFFPCSVFILFCYQVIPTASTSILTISHIAATVLSNLHIFIPFYIWHYFRLHKTTARIIQASLIYFSFKLLKCEALATLALLFSLPSGHLWVFSL